LFQFLPTRADWYGVAFIFQVFSVRFWPGAGALAMTFLGWLSAKAAPPLPRSEGSKGFQICEGSSAMPLATNLAERPFEQTSPWYL
jgi:hypothetical protein